MSEGQDLSKKWVHHAWKATLSASLITESEKTIKLVPNNDGAPLAVHVELLCYFSCYYAAALKGQFSEAWEDTLPIELNAEELQIFVTWLYTGQVVPSETPILISLYIFTDKTDIPALRRELISKISSKSYPQYHDIGKAFSNLPSSSPLCQYLVDWYVHHWSAAEDDAAGDAAEFGQATKEFHYRVMCGLAALRYHDKVVCPCCNHSCNYHEHESKEEWELTCKSRKRRPPAALTPLE